MANKISLEWQWTVIKISSLIFFLIPEIGGLGLFIAAIGTSKAEGKRLLKYPLNLAIIIYSLWLILISFLAKIPQESFLGLGNFLPFLFMLIALTPVINTPEKLRQLAWRLVLPSLGIVFLGLGQLFYGWGVPRFLRSIISGTLTPYGEPTGRMSSFFMYANLLGAYLLVIFILGLGLWIETYQTWREDKTPSKQRLLGLLTLTLIADGLGLILTNSRNAWGLLVLAGVIFALYLGWRWIVVLMGVIIGSIAGAAWAPSPLKELLRKGVPAYFWARLSDELYPDRPIATLRITQWKFAANMALQRPINGWGLRNFTPLYKSQMELWLGHPHNLFLMLMAETGFVGTLLLVGIVGGILGQGVQVLRQNLILEKDRLIFLSYLLAFGGLTLFNGFDVTLLDGKINALGWLLLSGIGGIVYQATTKHPDHLMSRFSKG